MQQSSGRGTQTTVGCGRVYLVANPKTIPSRPNCARTCSSASRRAGAGGPGSASASRIPPSHPATPRSGADLEPRRIGGGNGDQELLHACMRTAPYAGHQSVHVLGVRGLIFQHDPRRAPRCDHSHHGRVLPSHLASNAGRSAARAARGICLRSMPSPERTTGRILRHRVRRTGATPQGCLSAHARRHRRT